MDSGQRLCQFGLLSRHKQLPNGIDRTHSHPCRASAGKKTKDHLFPKVRVGSAFSESASNSESRRRISLSSIGVNFLNLFDS